MPHQIQRKLPVILMMILIFVVSSIPDLPSNRVDIIDFIVKKTAHVLEYALLYFLIYRSFNYKEKLKSALITLGYAFTDEIHQLFVPGRTGRLRDVAIDGLGIILVILLIKYKPWKLFIPHTRTKKLGR